MSAAELQLWARNHNVTRAEIRNAINRERTLVKTSLMRQTLHIIAASDFSLYISALKTSRRAAMLRIMSRFRVKPAELDALNESIVDALKNGPLTNGELKKRVEPNSSKNVKAWMAKVWSPLRFALIEGFICYGPDRGTEITYVRADHWLPNQPVVEAAQAQRILLSRFLHAYGPATPQDFSKWSGITMKEVKPVWESLAEELDEVSIEGQRAWFARNAIKRLEGINSQAPSLRLLPSFDPYLLAHASKKHLVAEMHYKKIYRNAGWITPVVLMNGRAAGIWSSSRRSSGISLEVELFEKLSKPLRSKLQEEAVSLGRFLGTPTQLKFSK